MPKLARPSVLRIGTLTALPSFERGEAMSDAAAQVMSLAEGPYRIAEDSRPEHVRLVRRNDIGPGADEVHYIAFPPEAGGLDALVAAIESGEIDVSSALPVDAAGRLTNVTVRRAPGQSTAILFVNSERERLRSAAVRRAIAMALDRREITEAAHGDVRELVAAGLLPPTLRRRKLPSNRRWPFDPRDAKRTIEEAGLAGVELTMVTPWASRPYLGDPWRAGEAIAEQLAAVGLAINVRPAATPRAALDLARDGDYDLFLVGWSTIDSDAAGFLAAILHSDAIPGSGGREPAQSCNLGRLADPEMDAALAAASADPTLRPLDAVETLAAERAVAIPLCYGLSILVWGPRVKSIRILAGGVPDVVGAELVR